MELFTYNSLLSSRNTLTFAIFDHYMQLLGRFCPKKGSSLLIMKVLSFFLHCSQCHGLVCFYTNPASTGLLEGLFFPLHCLQGHDDPPALRGRVQYLYGISLQDWFKSRLVYIRPESDLSSLETSF